MDKVKLLKKFYMTIDKTTMKLECKCYGFEFLDMLKRHSKVDYIEHSPTIHKYKLSGMTEFYYDYFLKSHVLQEANVCGYYNKMANDLFSFNLDTNKKVVEDSLLELQAAVKLISDYLKEFKIWPIVYNSGRGYHIVVKLTEPVDNIVIIKLMKYIWLRTFVTMYRNGLDKNKISISMYPNRHKEEQTNSLRWFGSKHIKTNQFSSVVIPEGTLDEQDSWQYFESYMSSYFNTRVMLEQAIKEHEEYFKRFWRENFIKAKTSTADICLRTGHILDAFLKLC
jgi:hypothetical protein